MIARSERTYEDDRELLVSVENQWLGGGPTTLSKYAYTYDALARRGSCVRTGTAFGATSGDHHDDWGYNDRNELDDSDRYNTFDPDPNDPNDHNPADADHAFDRAYAYDPIGNREWSKEGTDPNTAYTANNLNQYTATQDLSPGRLKRFSRRFGDWLGAAHSVVRVLPSFRLMNRL